MSDWSSDVCSSDLVGGIARRLDRLQLRKRLGIDLIGRARRHAARAHHIQRAKHVGVLHADPAGAVAAHRMADETAIRSEEHTSELQSLMRISYAVFCLKKKKTDKRTTENNQMQIEQAYTYYYI